MDEQKIDHISYRSANGDTDQHVVISTMLNIETAGSFSADTTSTKRNVELPESQETKQIITGSIKQQTIDISEQWKAIKTKTI